MIHLSLDELKLIAKNRDIKDYENKSEKDLIKILSEPKPKITILKKKIKEIKYNFSELRHRFSKKEIYKSKKSFQDIKKNRNLSTVEIRETEKNLIELENSLLFKKFHYDDYNNEYKKIKSVRRLILGLNKDYYKPRKTDDSFAGKKIATQNIRAEEIDIDIYHQKNILIWLDHI